LWQSFLLSKALKVQQESEDRKNEFINNDLEKV
jgi:chromosome segregation ATPase